MIRELLLVYKIWRWHDKQFANLSADAQERKFHGEIDEFNEAKAKYIKTRYAKRYKYASNLKEETADVIIAGLNLLKYPDFYERVAVKHNINTHRTWKGVHHDE
jgi:NTP pyrophosphatase (non-canonical NTP hydrolase)